ncbi:MAG: transglycosylase SLT domain-containing protein [Chloracidobacterium sp.]|nr:transglycosylase SLT domain-containing protein [Chloracidobacterium sp.]
MKKLSAVLLVMIFAAAFVPAQSDAELRAAVEKDKADRDAAGKLPTLTAAEHAERAEAYFENRHFPEAREHYAIVLDKFADDALKGRAMFVVGRSYMWERQYADAIVWLDRVWREFPATKDGREALAFKGACHVRLRKYADAARIYEQYTVMYPTGERIDSAYLNTIDAHREAGDHAAANSWVDKARQRFAGTAIETNALHARVRMEIYRRRWNQAVAAADVMIERAIFGGAMATMDEVKYLKAFALEKSGRRADAMTVYASIPANAASYYAGLAADKLAAGDNRVRRVVKVSPGVVSAFPAAYRDDVLRYAKRKHIDPRFILAIMKQESAFRPGAKSPSAARGLMQFVFDTAVKYKAAAGFPHLRPDDLYLPQVSIALGVEYIAALRDQFGGLNEAIAASYNGGEDNAARWLERSNPKESAIFTSEIGFAQTKDYVQKVMANYRTYRDLYDEHLVRK